ncbi:MULTISPECIES: hypothetical protein [Mycobacterium avium complex (MAC)]|uniref:Uncharacterized protein n=1 Tax=Mycobacterium colombiense TaxID=339268 RepID=A0A329LJK8_9MYCO|nr:MULTISPECIES: hypothetical protein [Mycobacterium avium complex (MAC)]RAV07989.1 hypothetical protein DQP57_17660 [Mycobacterium colombiense]
MVDAVSPVIRDGKSWPIGTHADAAWITTATSIGVRITSAIPPIFDDYATVLLPKPQAEKQSHDRAIVALLTRQSPDQQWWIGYLDTGSADVVFPDAPRVTLYANWPYVLVQAGPEQAACWRSDDLWSSRSTRLPDLMFPVDRSWLVSTLWDDDWTCVGGPVPLIDGFLSDPDLRTRVRRVGPTEDATPPGRNAI